MRAIVLLLAAALCCGSVRAAVPHQINYQGYLTATGGTPVNATVAMVLNLYNVDTGGATLYTETQTVTVTNGVFNVVIGSVTPLPLPFDVPYWLGVKVGTDAEMAPRQPVAASAYAIRSATTEALAVTATVPGSQITGAVSSAANFTGALAGDVTGTQGATAIAAATVTGKALTGFASAAGTITAADTVLTAVNKLNGNVALRAPLASPTFTGTVNATGDVNMTGSLRKSGSLFLHNLGTGNIALGISALPVTSTGQFNNAVGNGALAQNSSGVQNNALGGDALGANSTGSANTAVGDQALRNNVGGSNNVAVGDNALLNATGTGNIGIGAGAGENLTTGGGNIAIGNSGVAGESGTIRIGDSATQTRTMLAGTVGIGTASPLTDTKLHVVSNSPKATIATTRALAVTTNDASNPFALDVKMVGAAAQTDRGVILQTADWNSSDGGNILLQPQGGNVGIGTTTPTKAKLEISGSSIFNMGTFGGLFNTGAAVAPQPAQAMNVSVYANANIAASVFVAFSDERIKHVAGRSDAARDLATLAAIEVTDYSYIDTATKGTGKHKKVVAQQVEKVYPQAVSRSTDVVPDIYRKAQVQDGWVKLATNLKKGERVRLIGKNKEGIHEVLEVAPGRFRTDFAAEGDAVFVFGREVKDFRMVDYEAIAMLNVSATQEVNRRLERQAAEFAAQTVVMNAQTARIAELEKQASEIAMLKQQMAELQVAGLEPGRFEASRLAAAK